MGQDKIKLVFDPAAASAILPAKRILLLIVESGYFRVVTEIVNINNGNGLVGIRYVYFICAEALARSRDKWVERVDHSPSPPLEPAVPN